MNVGNNVVSANTTKINTNAYTGSDLKVSSKTSTLNLKELDHKYNIKQSNSIDDFKNIDLEEKEYSFEELMKAGEKRYDELQEQLEKDQAAAQNFEDKVKNASGNLDEKKIDELCTTYNSLTEDQKALVDPDVKKHLEQMKKDYKKRKEEEEKIKTERKKQEEELQALYKARDENNGVFHPKREAELEAQILALEKKLGVAHKPDGWEKFCDGAEVAGAHAATFVVSAVEGFVDLGEGVIDAHIYGAAETLQLFGVDDKWAEDIIAYDVSGKMYDSFVDWSGIDEDIAYGASHSIGNFAGEMVGYYALSAVPFVGTALCCIGGAGSAVEDSINRQLGETGTVNDWVVFGESALGALEGYGFGKAAKGVQAGFKAVKKAGVKGVLKQTFGSITKESFKQTVKKGRNIALQTAGQTLKDPDLYVDTASVLTNNVVNGVETGEWKVGRMVGETTTVFLGNYASNLFGNVVSDASYKNKFNAEMDAKTPEQKSQSWEDYYKQTYGADAVEHTSGIDVAGSNGSVVDPAARDYNNKMNRFAETMPFNENMNVKTAEERSVAWSDYYNSKYGAVGVEHTSSPWTTRSNTNILNNFRYNEQEQIDFVVKLHKNGYSDHEIVSILSEYSDACSDYNTKRAFGNLSYEFLLSSGYKPEDAANMISNVYRTKLDSRGMTQVLVDNNGIKYNFSNDFNLDNQAYTLEYVKNQINGLPEGVRKSINEVNFYDTFNPGDYYWHAKGYANNGYFVSAATAGNGQINIWHNKYVSDGVIPHEAGHCFDVNRKYSNSPEYLEAIRKDSLLTGRQSITKYGGNSLSEDFADTMAAYKNGYVFDEPGKYSTIDQFPNRMEFMQKNIKVNGQQYLSIYNRIKLDEVTNLYGKKDMIGALYNYISTGKSDKLPFFNSHSEFIVNMDINEVIEYYNILNGGFK